METLNYSFTDDDHPDNGWNDPQLDQIFNYVKFTGSGYTYIECGPKTDETKYEISKSECNMLKLESEIEQLQKAYDQEAIKHESLEDNIEYAKIEDAKNLDEINRKYCNFADKKRRASIMSDIKAKLQTPEAQLGMAVIRLLDSDNKFETLEDLINSAIDTDDSYGSSQVSDMIVCAGYDCINPHQTNFYDLSEENDINQIINNLCSY